MGLHKANPSEIYAGLSGGGARNAIGKDATPCSILSGCSAPASYFLMTAKQCECWVPNGDLLVTEAEQLMEANGLDGLDAVYKHIHERGLQYVAPPPFAGGGPPAKPQRERRPSRDYVQDVSVMGFSYDELEKLRRSREASLDEASVETATTAAKRAEPARRDRRPSGDVVQGVSVMGFSLGGLEKLRKERLAAQEYEEEIAAASATSTPVSRRSRSASSSGDSITQRLPQDPVGNISLTGFSIAELEKLRIQRERMVNAESQ
jgi:hypothetical protein